MSIVLLLDLLDKAGWVGRVALFHLAQLIAKWFIDNVVVNQLFGVTTGLGMGILTFDWSQILYAGNPLNVPWWAQVNVGISFVVIYWIIVPILYYTNVCSAHGPSSCHVVDRRGYLGMGYFLSSRNHIGSLRPLWTKL
jgi:hypothetical protein